MSGVRVSRMRVAALCLVLAIGVIATIAGTTAQAAGPAGCIARATSLSNAKFCDFKSKTGLVEIIGAGEAWAVWVTAPYYDECTYDQLGAESTVCFVGSGSTVEAGVILGVVSVRDVPL